MSEEVSQSVKDLVKILQPGVTIGENGVGVSDKDLFEKTFTAAPEGVTMESFNANETHKTNVSAAMTQVTADLGEVYLKKNKKADHVSTEMKMGKHGDISVGYLRSQEQRIPNFKDKNAPPETVTRYGVLTPRVRHFAHKNKGDMKKVRLAAAERGEKLFS
jgi:hypothetical protein